MDRKPRAAKRIKKEDDNNRPYQPPEKREGNSQEEAVGFKVEIGLTNLQ